MEPTLEDTIEAVTDAVSTVAAASMTRRTAMPTSTGLQEFRRGRQSSGRVRMVIRTSSDAGNGGN